jgi:hypothetical protein
MKKPRLTARIVRGLEAIYALADVNQFEDSDLYAGCRDDAGRCGREAMREVNDAVAWLGSLIQWHRTSREQT